MDVPECEMCGNRDARVLIKHHVSYYPEIIQILCCNCHHLIHHHLSPEGITKRIQTLTTCKGNLEDIMASLQHETEQLKARIPPLRTEVTKLEFTVKKLEVKKNELKDKRYHFSRSVQNVLWDEHLQDCIRVELKRFEGNNSLGR